jgi:hypothetical protein
VFLVAKINENLFWGLVVLWLIVSFFVMWFIGGACIDFVHGTNCVAQNSLQGLRNIPIIGLILPYDNWSSLMYFFAPIAGFLMSIVLILWWNEKFDTKEAASIAFPVILIIALLLGYFINLSIYVGESAKLGSNSSVKYNLYFCFTENDSSLCSQNVSRINQELISQAQSAGAQSVQQNIPIAFWPELRRSMYFLFILGAISAWVPLFCRGLYEKYVSSE